MRTTSLYDVVRRLHGAGLISADEPARAGNRPERTPFTITDAGRAELAVWLGEVLADDTDADSLPAALSFMYSLGRDRVVRLPILLSEHHLQLAHRRAERDWLETFVTALSTGALAWPG